MEKKIDKDLQNSPLWTNFGYYVGFLVASFISYKKNNVWLLLIAILLLCTAVVSTVYHTRTPAFVGNREGGVAYSNLASADMVLTIVTVVLTVIYMIFYCRPCREKLYNPAAVICFLLAIIFIIVAFICFAKATKAREKLKTGDLDQKGVYNLFHSYWHIYSSVGALFVFIFISYCK